MAALTVAARNYFAPINPSSVLHPVINTPSTKDIVTPQGSNIPIDASPFITDPEEMIPGFKIYTDYTSQNSRNNPTRCAAWPQAYFSPVPTPDSHVTGIRDVAVDDVEAEENADVTSAAKRLEHGSNTT